MGVPFEINLMLVGIAAATCVVLFIGPRGRRIVMGFGLACASSIVMFQLIGVFRTLVMGVIAYWVIDWLSLHMEQRREREEQAAPVLGAPGGDAVRGLGFTSRGSNHHRQGCSGR
ncbi:MAG: hypothetical protein ACREGL_04665 [Alphaproteobacteria bacterium]